MGSVPILLSSAASAQLFLVNLYVYVGVLSSSSSRVSRGRLFFVSSRGIILCVRACINVLGCGSFVRGRKRKKGDSISFILSRRDYIARLPDECP